MTLSTPIKRSGSLGFGLATFGGVGRSVLRQDVTATTIDEIVRSRNLTRLDLIKLDIEGWELRALIGASDVLEKFHPALFMEVNDRQLARAGDDADSLFNFLSQLGYEGYVVAADGTHLVLRSAPCEGDIFFIAEGAR